VTVSGLDALPAAASLAAMSEGGHRLVWGVRHWMVANVRGEGVPSSVLRLCDPFAA
jgi:hypothetical protein